MKKNAFDFGKKILAIISIIVLITIFILLLLSTKDNDLVKDIKEYVKTDTKVLYISNKNNYSKNLIELLDKYEVRYKYVDSTKLSNFERVKIENIINSKYLSNIILIYKNGQIIDALIDYEDEENLYKFLQNNNIIPEVIADTSGIIDKVHNSLETDLTLLYIPYKNIDNIDSQDKILKSISEEYEIQYKKIDAYLLSYFQQEKLNSILQISSVEDQIIILIKDKKIIGSIRGINKKKDYLNKLYEYKFIDEIDNYIKPIIYEDFENILTSNEKTIILIGKDDCRYCSEVISILNTIIVNYDITVNYINIANFESELSSKVEKKLTELGFSDGFTTPLLIMTESNKLLDYVIGLSSEQYFIDIFTENGIIK